MTKYHDDQLDIIRKEYDVILADAVKNPDIQYFHKSLLDKLFHLYQKVQTIECTLRERMSVIESFCVTSNKEDREKAGHLYELRSRITELSAIEDELVRLMDID
jgi:hypothetical protein